MESAGFQYLEPLETLEILDRDKATGNTMYDADTTHSATSTKSRGGLFFAIDRAVWAQLWTLETANALHLVTAFLVLCAGSGADHQLTKWSAKAIEEYTGIGKPRGQRAIQELIDHGLISRTPQSTRMFPQYRLPAPDREADPIFLPVQLVTGLGGATPILRRLREVGDPEVLRMLVDLYGLVQVDATYAPSTACLMRMTLMPARKLFETGVHAVWALDDLDELFTHGPWQDIYRHDGDVESHLATLQRIGALDFEDWIFDNDAADAEPMFPVDRSVLYGGETHAARLTSLAHQASCVLAGENYGHTVPPGKVLVPLPVHHQPPSLRGVARLTVEADTPGRRLAFAQRMERIEGYTAAFTRLIGEAMSGDYGKVLRLMSNKFKK